MGRIRWLLAVLLLPLGITSWLVLVSLWIALWSAGNAVIAARDDSLPALGRAVDGAARSAAVSSWIAAGWGTLAPVLPVFERAAEAGELLGEVAEAGRRAAPVIPAALGQSGPRNYLVAILNDAELFGSGGAPLSALVVGVEQGKPTISVSGSVSSELNPDNVPYAWDVEGGMPWYREGAEYPFANANYHPDFPVSGRNLVAAWNALGYEDVDGVLTIDVTAVSAVLRTLGPVETEGYGQVTADTVVQALLVDAYRDYPEWMAGADVGRQQANAELQAAVIDRLRDWRTALRAARALWDVLPSRHVQVFMSDPSLQASVAAIGADGALSPPVGDVLGVFSQSAPSKLAVFQHQRIERRVEVAADGSARASQRVMFTNAVPEGLSGDSGAYRGYLALNYRQRVAYRVPASATDLSVLVEDARALIKPEGTGPFPDGAGAQVLWQGQDIRPGQSGATSLEYGLPPGTFDGLDSLEYTLTADPQARVVPATLDLTVTFPEGSTARGTGPGWDVEGAVAHWAGTLDQPLELTVQD